LTTPVGPLPSFFVTVQVQVSTNGKRQLTAENLYLQPDGTTTQDCHSAAQYILQGDQLLLNGVPISTDRGVAEELFVVNNPVGSITTTFIMNGTNVVWMNSNFDGNAARFARSSTGEIRSYFIGPLPASSTLVDLVPADISICPSQSSSGLSTLSSSISRTTSVQGSSSVQETSSVQKSSSVPESSLIPVSASIHR
jgi:hypothetical protein